MIYTANIKDLIGLDAGVGLADPPIPFVAWSPAGDGPRSPQTHYRCEEFEALADMPVGKIFGRDAFLFLWLPLRSIDWVHPLMRVWDFTFSGSGFVWIKTNKTKPGLAWGTGFGTRKNAEVCWLGRRGKARRLSAGVHEVIMAPRRGHSRKPDEAYGRIEQFCAGPRVELFATQHWPGWHVFGDEHDKYQPDLSNFKEIPNAEPSTCDDDDERDEAQPAA